MVRRMDLNTAIVFTVGSIAGSIIITQMWQLNWFKRENFKMQKANIMKENRIKYKKLERELGLSQGRSATDNKVDLSQLVSMISPQEDEDTETGGIEGLIGNFVNNNPELVQGLINKYTKSGTNEDHYQN